MKKYFYIIIILLFLVIIIPFSVYRISFDTSEVFISEIKFQMVDLGQGDVLRNSFESLLGNKRVFIKGGSWIYVNESQYKECIKIPPFKLKEDSLTVKIEYEASKLLFGGYSIANIIKVDKVDGLSLITK